jgi:hypothetical protein
MREARREGERGKGMKEERENENRFNKNIIQVQHLQREEF